MAVFWSTASRNCPITSGMLCILFTSSWAWRNSFFKFFCSSLMYSSCTSRNSSSCCSFCKHKKKNFKYLLQMLSAQTQVLFTCKHAETRHFWKSALETFWTLTHSLTKFNIVFPKDYSNTVRRCRDTHLKPVSIIFKIVLSLKPCIYCKGPQDLQALELKTTDQSEVWMSVPLPCLPVG